MFKKDRKWAGEKIILTTRPNFLLGNKGALIGCLFLGALIYFYSLAVRIVASIGGTSRGLRNLPLVSWTTDVFLIIGVIIVIYIIYKIISWSTFKYTVTSARITVDKGLIRRNKSSMPYNTVQDVQIDQGILGRLFGIGSVILYSAYDGNNLELKQISNPQDIEELVFDQLQQNMVRNEPISPLHNQYQEENNQNQQYHQNIPNNQYLGENYQNLQNTPHEQYQNSPNNQYLGENYQNLQNDHFQQEYIENTQKNNNSEDIYPIHTQEQVNNENYQQKENNNGFNYTTNTYSINSDGNHQDIYEEPRTYTDEEFNDSINEAIKNLDNNVKFQQQEENQNPVNNIEPNTNHNQEQTNYQREVIENIEPHNLYEDSIKDSYADDKTQYYREEKDYGSEEERENVLERHSSKFNKYRIRK